MNSPLSSRAFWKDTHGTCEGRTCDGGAVSDLVITPLTRPFTQGDPRRYAPLPADCGYATYDMAYVMAGAIALWTMVPMPFGPR